LTTVVFVPYQVSTTFVDTLCSALDHSLGGWGREDLCTVLAAAEGLQVLGLSRNRFDEEAVTPPPLPT
jgi:hypothetical protein